MVVISSQKYLNYDIVAEKLEELEVNSVNTVVIPVVKSFMKDDEGNELFIMIDKHHTLEAAKELGVDFVFEIVEDTDSYCTDLENKNGEEILKAHFNDSNWYYVTNPNEYLIGADVW